MLMPPDPTAPFGELLGHLVLVLRSSPERQDLVQAALAALVARAAHGAARIEAGIENSWAVDGDTLKERLQHRRVDSISVARAAPGPELLALAQALADDQGPLPASTHIQVALVTAPVPVERPLERMAASDPALPTVPRARPGDQLAGVVEGILRELEGAVRKEQWHTVLHNAQAALRLFPGMGEEVRRPFAIAVKRLLSRAVVEQLIEQAYRIPEEQARTAEVLRAGGLPAAEQVLEVLRRGGAVGPRAFLLDAVGGMPEAFPMVAPLAKSAQPAEAWLGVELLGRLGVADAIPLLRERVTDADEKVRHAAIDALGRFREKGAVEPLRQALAHLSPETRARAGRALAARGVSQRSSGGIAMPLFAAFEVEKDPVAWQDLLETLVRLDAAEVTAALARVALERRGFLRFGAGDARRQLAIVRALGERGSPAARQALERIAAEGRGEVGEAARAALSRPPAAP
ncbi:MAG: HEAT repeat domain-containing protein [Gemmatimonadetes bacterium]|nr:HEAT repeat domain-containing protein [Gemmatimonadota bacterium]MBK6782191.1 HEAT repeat domain-containing protein [Gemmatimonadota bacterium]MBK7351919.1 HEAT repeat domain-containing protein [Gemmatimonadota bacterium]MBK7785043.1 HEAT repeat domain-containing protein [Gemmatimonadota bacterium]MBK7923412.1 HEAT repeat domain-containing protein [Gemmatimonadota bacterium]